MPIEHSLSPVLHAAAYAALGLSGWDYGRYAVDEAGLPEFVAGLGPEWVGLSLTMPLKRVALEVADEVAADTAAIGAANTLVRRPSGWLAVNTDVAGIEESLRELGAAAVERAVVIGAGGTAQAALAALRRLGELAPTVLVRDPARRPPPRSRGLPLRGGCTTSPPVAPPPRRAPPRRPAAGWQAASRCCCTRPSARSS